MSISTIDIIKLLPFEKPFKEELLISYETFIPDQKFEVSQMLWTAYAAYYQALYNQNMEEALENAADGKGTLATDFATQSKARTEKQIMEGLDNNSKEINLTTTRIALDDVVNKIKAIQ